MLDLIKVNFSILLRNESKLSINTFHIMPDDGCFACGTKYGFQIFNCHPFRQTFKRGKFFIHFCESACFEYNLVVWYLILL
jgi:hypothetical protein